MLLVMFSMIGVPPLAGFYAKWWILAAVINAGHIWLAITAVLFSVIGAFYYLRVVKFMYFDEASDLSPIEAPVDLRVLLTANGLLLLGLGLFPGGLIALCARAIS